MGYTTDFWGEFKLDKPLAPEHKEYLKKFAETRRMKRDASKTEHRPDPIREATGLPVGPQGGYFVGAGGMMGQEGMFGSSGSAPDLMNSNEPPSGQPGLWCQWVPNEDGTAIVWDGGEKFYYYIEWLRYLVEHFLQPWGYALDGEVHWQGEESGDTGVIVAANNHITSGRSSIEVLGGSA